MATGLSCLESNLEQIRRMSIAADASRKTACEAAANRLSQGGGRDEANK